MFVNESINICEATRSTISLLELGKIEGIVTGIGLAIIASIGLVIKALFVWYIQYRAPKDRPINTLIWYDQLFQFILGLPCLTMTILPILTQTPLSDYIGNKGCNFYWIIYVALNEVLSIGGFGMAVFRLFCLQNLWKKVELKRNMAKNILIAEVTLIFCILMFGFYLAESKGLESAVFYQYCTNQNPHHANIISTYREDISVIDPTPMWLFLKILTILIFQACAICEMLIYAKIIYDLWKHNKTFHQEGVITLQMRKQRNHKNVITLKGQMVSFSVEIVYSVLLIGSITYSSNDGPSFMPVLMTFFHTIVSASQLLSSHELKQCFKELLDV